MQEQVPVDVSAVDLTFAAFLLPPIISVINQKHWSKQAKGLVAMGVCLVYSLLAVIIQGSVDWHDWRNAIIQVTAATFAAYKWWWGPTNIGPSIEAATSFRHHASAGDAVTPEDDTIAFQDPGDRGPL